ncbi:hypothetical protein ACJMK2_041720 [Sinanodonta woodiana]|uniref:C2 domain-containing protein n=1 Tax=Sinanodonta woodiana TaxID=1069815 RepID=A0ABD3W8T8_SINWO
MFGKKTSAPVMPQRKGAALMNQMGLGGSTDMSQMEAVMYGDLENDDELEAELLALQGDVPKAKPRNRIGKGPVNPAILDQMIAASVKDIPSDEEVSDTEDPELMAELEGMIDHEEDNDRQTPQSVSAPPVRAMQDNVSLLQARIANYQEAVENAKATGDSSKQRRLDRGLKTLQDLFKNAKAGKPIDEAEIPPPVVIVSKPKSALDSQPVPEPGSSSTSYPVFEPTSSHESRPQPPRRSAPPPPSPSTAPISTSSGLSLSEKDQEAHMMLCERRDQYKHAALEAKRNGDINTATKYVRTAKQFDAVIGALEEGKPVDLSKMPPPPPVVSVGNFSKDTNKESSLGVSPVKVQRSSVQTAGKNSPEEPVAVPPPPSADEERALFNAPDAPKTVLEALQQRFQKYTSVEAEAKAENNSNKARRIGRIVKQYQDAIKDYKAGKPVNFDELPTPPGFGPIPVQSTALTPAPATRPTPSSSAGATGDPSGNLQPPSKGQKAPSPVAVTKAPISQHPQQKTQSPGQSDTRGKAPALKRSYSSRADYQANFLKERMQEYKNAAIQAKKNNNIELAKKYLRQAKGFEPMIEAAESGLPVDLTQVPPSLEDDSSEPGYVIVSQEDFVPSENREETFKNLEQDLIAQMQKCAANNLHFSKLGDVATATSFQKMEQGLKKDLEALKNSFRLGEPVPKFHYENRTFSMVQCNTDLGDNDVVIEVVRGIQYNPPSGYSEKDLDTYVKFEFPFPTEDPQVGQTDTVKGTFNPEYKHSAKLQMNRKSRAFVRVVERKAIKCEVFYKRGFLKSDKLLGTVNVKFQPLESQCTAHDSYDLMDGRKAVGGKLEVKVRIRDPFKNKQVEEVKEKWLVIDQFLRTMEPKKVS